MIFVSNMLALFVVTFLVGVVGLCLVPGPRAVAVEVQD